MGGVNLKRKLNLSEVGEFEDKPNTNTKQENHPNYIESTLSTLSEENLRRNNIPPILEAEEQPDHEEEDIAEHLDVVHDMLPTEVSYSANNQSSQIEVIGP